MYDDVEAGYQTVLAIYSVLTALMNPTFNLSFAR